MVTQKYIVSHEKRARKNLERKTNPGNFFS